MNKVLRFIGWVLDVPVEFTVQFTEKVAAVGGESPAGAWGKQRGSQIGWNDARSLQRGSFGQARHG
jgi:hypothetical protein